MDHQPTFENKAGALFYVCLLLSAFLVSRSIAEERPNILFILADDLGWSDLGCYGNEIFETPRLDQFAAEGTRFTQAYAAAPICSASRAAILTGKTPARLGFEFVVKSEAGYQPVEAPLRAPPFTLDLPLEETTIAEVLRDAGYQTGFFGKWHLNKHYERYLGWSPTHGPKAQGFEVAEEDFGSHPYSYGKQKTKRSFLDVPDGEFLEDGLTGKAIEFLKQDHDRPFFLMVSHFYVHDPIHTRVKWLYDHYMEKIPVDHPRRKVLAHYGAMVTALDHYVGQLLDALDEAGLADSTYVVFTSDNGGHPNYAGNAPLRGSKWNLYEGGIRVPMLIRSPDKVGEGIEIDAPVWSLDLSPTFAALADTNPKTEYEGRNLRPLREHPDIEWTEAWPVRQMFWHFPYYHPEKNYADAPNEIGVDDGFTSKTKPHSAIRNGAWKLLHFYEDGRDELYDIPSSDMENAEVARFYGGQADQAKKMLLDYLEAVNARQATKHPDLEP